MTDKDDIDVNFGAIVKAEFGFEDSKDQAESLHPPVGSVEDSELVELQRQIIDVLTSIEDWAPKAKQLSIEATQIKEEKKSYLVEVNRHIQTFDAKLGGLDREKRQIEADLRAAEDKKNKLLADIDHHLEAQKAQQLLEEARERWQEIIARHEWLWAISARDYQRKGIEFIASAVDRDLGGVALLDQMGLGKTLQARGAVDLIQNHPRFEEMLGNRLNDWSPKETWTTAVLWVCPDQIKESTQQELAKWSDAPVIVLDGTPDYRAALVRLAHSAGMTLVVGYAQVRDRAGGPVVPELFNHEWPLMVADEIQEARNEDTSTFENVRKLVRKSGFFIPMSGTPVENKAKEFWVTLHLLSQKGKRQGEFPTSSQFERMYLYSTSQYFMHGAFERLMKSVADMVLRRRKDEVMTDLPDKVRSVRFVHLRGKQRELYDQMRDKLYVWLDEQKSDAVSATNFLAQLTRLRQINLVPSGVKVKHADGTETVLDCNESAKLDDAMGLIRLMMQSNEKCLVFANFNHALYELQKRIADEGLTWTDSGGEERPVITGAITGDFKGDIRTETANRFNNPKDDLRVIVGNVKAMGLGLNLQGACSQCIFLDLYWNPAKNEQAEDRLHRLGQKDNVTIHIIQGEETVDGFIAQIIESKHDVFTAMFERKELRRALDEGLI